MGTVALVHWPKDSARREQLALARVPTLLLVASDAAPPAVDTWEDWIRLPADERDVSIRMQGLARRVRRPELIDGAVLRSNCGSVMLSPPESAVAWPLIRSDGQLVSREELERAVWPDGAPTARALDDLVYRLRRRIKPLHLDVFRAWGRGFVLGAARPVTAAVPPIDSELADD